MLAQDTTTPDNAEGVLDKRFSPRYPVRLPIHFSGDLVNGRGQVFNLSSSGCGVQTGNRVKGMKGGLYVHALLRLPQERIPLKIELAAVRWANDTICGMEFIRMSLKQQQRLRDYLDFLKPAALR